MTNYLSFSAYADGITVFPLHAGMEQMRLEAVGESEGMLAGHFSWCRSPYDASQNRQYILDAEQMLSERKGLFLSVIHRQSGIYLGETGVDEITGDGGRMNVFYWIRESCQNKGYATAAVRLLLELAGNYLPPGYAEIRMQTGNLVSKRV